MANGVYKITEEFERALGDYTGAPYVVTVDNMSNALFLALMYEGVIGSEITIPARTYPSVPCEIIHAGAKVKFEKVEGTTLKGMYQLKPTNVWDSALRLQLTCTFQVNTSAYRSLDRTSILNCLRAALS